MGLKFKCSGCGLCCRKVETAVEATKHIPALKFPYTWDENGKCEMLLDDNSCKVYENRPLLCNVERVAKFFKLNKKKFYAVNHKSCLQMQEMNNTEEKYRLKL